MKRPPSKKQIRAELEEQIQNYLHDGGVVQNIPRGLSGHSENHNLFGSLGENAPRQERTPLDEVVKILDARKNKPESSAKKNKRPRKKLIKDDFGEPLRWVWVDE